MIRYILTLFLLLPALAFGQLLPDLGGQRVGISTAQFLKIGVGARSIGMGESFVAVADDAEALYWNPAGLTLTNQTTAFFSHTSWLVDIELEYGGLVHQIDGSNTIGLAFTYLH